MIKFFRKIRQNLLMENKTGKYLKYAIGEILLVMIGILLALQVNTWNNQRIDKNKEHDILENLQEDFKFNVENITDAYSSFVQAYDASVELLDIIKNDDEINPDQVDRLINEIINKTKSYDFTTGSIDDLFNTGNIHLISDPELRKQVSNWSYYFSDTEDDIVIYRDYLFGIFIPSLTHRVRLRNMEIPSMFEEDLDLKMISKSDFSPDYEQNIRNFEFENQVYNNALNYMYVLNSYLVFQNYLEDTLEIIEANIQ